MAKINVKCLYCGEIFDRNNPDISFVKIKNRYAHTECHERHLSNITQEEKDIEAFFEYTKHLFGKSYNYLATKKMAERYVKENNYTYSGMLKTLKWYYEKEKHPLDKSNGSIGIIPYVYNQAMQYYYSLYQIQQLNKNKDISHFTLPKERVINIESPRVYVRQPHMWLEEEDGNEF